MPFVHIRRRRAYYETKGSGSPLLLIHGVGGTSLHWQKQITRYSDRHQVVAVDLPGCGRSQAPASGYSIEESAGFIAALITALHLDKPVIVGHSMGGYIALAFHQVHPRSAAGLVIVDSFVGFEGSPYKADLLRRLAIIEQGEPEFRALLKETARKLFVSGGDESFKRQVRAQYLNNDAATMSGHLHSVTTTIGRLFPDRTASLDWSRAIPVLVLSRDLDDDREAAVQAFASAIPNVRTKRFADVGHYLMIDDEPGFNLALSGFLEGIRTRHDTAH